MKLVVPIVSSPQSCPMRRVTITCSSIWASSGVSPMCAAAVRAHAATATTKATNLVMLKMFRDARIGSNVRAIQGDHLGSRENCRKLGRFI